MSDTEPSDNLAVAHLGPLTAAGASTWEAIAQLATLRPNEGAYAGAAGPSGDGSGPPSRASGALTRVVSRGMRFVS